jgi:hypothetical protein
MSLLDGISNLFGVALKQGSPLSGSSLFAGGPAPTVGNAFQGFAAGNSLGTTLGFNPTASFGSGINFGSMDGILSSLSALGSSGPVPPMPGVAQATPASGFDAMISKMYQEIQGELAEMSKAQVETMKGQSFRPQSRKDHVTSFVEPILQKGVPSNAQEVFTAVYKQLKAANPELSDEKLKFITAGIVGNFMAESGLVADINEGGKRGDPAGKGGFGFAQWTGSRQDDLIAFAGSKEKAKDPNVQIAFMIKEFQGSENKAWNALKGATTPENAATIMLKEYERAGVPVEDKRRAGARTVFNSIPT